MLCIVVTGSVLVSSVHLGTDLKVSFFPPCLQQLCDGYFRHFPPEGDDKIPQMKKRQELTKTAKNVSSSL